MPPKKGSTKAIIGVQGPQTPTPTSPRKTRAGTVLEPAQEAQAPPQDSRRTSKQKAPAPRKRRKPAKKTAQSVVCIAAVGHVSLLPLAKAWRQYEVKPSTDDELASYTSSG